MSYITRSSGTLESVRRGESPEAQEIRGKFERWYQDIRALSFLEKNPDAFTDVEKDELKDLCRESVDELRYSLSPYIAMLVELESPKWQEFNKVKLINYKTLKPSVKALNDDYLGPQLNDQYINDLHVAIRTLFSKDDVCELHSYFKGGYLMIGFNDDSNGQEDFAEKIAEFPKIASNLLFKRLEERRLEILRIQPEKENTLYDIQNIINGALPFNREIKEHLGLEDSEFNDLSNVAENLAGDIERLRVNLEKILDLERQYTDGGNQPIVELSFGPTELNVESKPLDKYFAVVKATWAANMAGESNEVVMQDFSPRLFLETLMKARVELQQRFSEAPEKYGRLFEIDEDNGYLRMRANAIYRYRKEKLDMDIEENKFFGDYYRAINVVDAVKPFKVDDFGSFHQRCMDIVSLIESADEVLNNSETGIIDLQHLLSNVYEQLELSIKNVSPVKKVAHTTKKVIRELLASEEETEGVMKFIFGDYIGFATFNQARYEDQVVQIIKVLSDGFGINLAQLNPSDVSGALNQAFSGKITAEMLFDQDFFKQMLLRFDDRGTERLRRKEEEVFNIINDCAEQIRGCVIPFGDEVWVGLKPNDGEKISSEIINRVMEPLDGLRLAITDFEGNLEKETKKVAGDRNRDGLKRFFKLLKWAEDEHSRLKAQEPEVT